MNCTDCDKAFSRTDALTKHVRTTHNEIMAPSRKLPTKKSDKHRRHDSGDLDAELSTRGAADDGGGGESDQEAQDIKDEALKTAVAAAETQKTRDDLQARFPGQDVEFLEYTVTLAVYKYILGERQRLREEHTVRPSIAWPKGPSTRVTDGGRSIRRSASKRRP